MRKNIFIPVVVVITTLFVFSSCKDDEKFTSSLFCDFISDTDKSGFFASNNYYTLDNIHNVGYSDDIVNIEYISSTITFEGITPGELRRGDIIKDVYIKVEGFNPFLFSRAIEVMSDFERISFSTYDDEEFYNFMWDVMRRFHRRDELDIEVYGRVVHGNVGVRNVRMRVTLDNLLDVTVSEFR